jgi:UrcA family protein
MTMNKTTTSADYCVNVRVPVLAVLATICLAVASTTVRAADMSSDSEPVKKTVTYGDLNLADSQGIEHLYRRIVGAAQQVCSPLNGRSLEEKQEFSICTTQSIARAVAAVDQPALTALQASKTGQPIGTTAKLAKR